MKNMMSNLNTILSNENCDSTFTSNLNQFIQTNTINNDIKIYYSLVE